MVLLADLDLPAGVLSEVNSFWGIRKTGVYIVDPTRKSSFLRFNFPAVHPASKYSVVKYAARFRD